MSEMSQAMDLYLKLVIDAERVMVKGSVELLKVIIALSTKGWLANQQKKELTGGERKIWQMLKSGSKVEAVTLTEEQLKLLDKVSKKYNIQYGETDSLVKRIKDKASGVDPKENLKTVFVRSSDWNQFEQFCKDYKITATSYGTVEGEIKKKPSVDNVIADFENNKKLYMNSNEEFDVGAWKDEYVKSGGDLDDGLFEQTLNKLTEYLLSTGISINAEALEQKVGLNPFSKDPAQDPIKKPYEKETEPSTTQQKSQNLDTKDQPNKTKKDSLDADRDAHDELDDITTDYGFYKDMGSINMTGTNEEAVEYGSLKNYALELKAIRNESIGDPTDSELVQDAELMNLNEEDINKAPSIYD